MPFLDSDTFGKANLNTAGRWTDYSTSGVVYTWKIVGDLALKLSSGINRMSEIHALAL